MNLKKDIKEIIELEEIAEKQQKQKQNIFNKYKKVIQPNLGFTEYKLEREKIDDVSSSLKNIRYRIKIFWNK